MAELQDTLAFCQSLLDLPVELLEKIFDYLPNPHLKVLSSKYKKMASIARTRLFHTMIVGLKKRQLRSLAGAARHSVLRHYVKHLCYDHSLYPVMTFDQYVEQLPPRQDEGTYTKQDQLVGYHHTQNLERDQWDIMKKTLDAQLYPKVLSQFPNLHQLTILYYSTGPYRYRYRAAPPASPTRKTNSFGPYLNGEQQRLLNSLSIRRLIRACVRAKVPIDTLYILSNPYYHDFYQDIIFGQLAKDERKKGYPFFQKLTTIDVTVENTPATFGNPTPPPWPVERSEFADLLPSAIGLKRLRFGYTKTSLYYVGGKTGCGVYYVPITIQFDASFYWKALRSLELHNMLLFQSELVSLLSSHANSLCEVSLVDIAIFHTAWAGVVDCLVSLPQLTCITIVRPKEVEEKFSVRPSKRPTIKCMSNRDVHEIPGAGEIWKRKIMGRRLNTLRSELCTPDIGALRV